MTEAEIAAPAREALVGGMMELSIVLQRVTRVDERYEVRRLLEDPTWGAVGWAGVPAVTSAASVAAGKTPLRFTPFPLGRTLWAATPPGPATLP